MHCLFSNVSPENFQKKESDLTRSDITRILVSVMVGNANTDLTASVQLSTRGFGENNFQRKIQVLESWNLAETGVTPCRGEGKAILQSEETATEARAKAELEARATSGADPFQLLSQ